MFSNRTNVGGVLPTRYMSGAGGAGGFGLHPGRAPGPAPEAGAPALGGGRGGRLRHACGPLLPLVLQGLASPIG